MKMYILLLIFIFTPHASSLQCFKCSAINEATCTSKQRSVTCNIGENACFESSTTIRPDNHVITKFKRGCYRGMYADCKRHCENSPHSDCKIQCCPSHECNYKVQSKTVFQDKKRRASNLHSNESTLTMNNMVLLSSVLVLRVLLS